MFKLHIKSKTLCLFKLIQLTSSNQTLVLDLVTLLETN